MTASGKGRRRKRKIALQQVTIRGLGQAVSLWIYLENAHNRLVGTDPLCYERQGRALRGYIPPGSRIFQGCQISKLSRLYHNCKKREKRIFYEHAHSGAFSSLSQSDREPATLVSHGINSHVTDHAILQPTNLRTTFIRHQGGTQCGKKNVNRQSKRRRPS